MISSRLLWNCWGVTTPASGFRVALRWVSTAMNDRVVRIAPDQEIQFERRRRMNRRMSPQRVTRYSERDFMNHRGQEPTKLPGVLGVNHTGWVSRQSILHALNAGTA